MSCWSSSIVGRFKLPALIVLGQIGSLLVRPDLTLAHGVHRSAASPAEGPAGPTPLRAPPIGLYITARAWKHVATALVQDATDVFIGTGMPYYDCDLGIVAAIIITTATTCALDRQQRAQSGGAAPEQIAPKAATSRSFSRRGTVLAR